MYLLRAPRTGFLWTVEKISLTMKSVFHEFNYYPLRTHNKLVSSNIIIISDAGSTTATDLGLNWFVTQFIISNGLSWFVASPSLLNHLEKNPSSDGLQLKTARTKKQTLLDPGSPTPWPKTRSISWSKKKTRPCPCPCPCHVQQGQFCTPTDTHTHADKKRISKIPVNNRRRTRRSSSRPRLLYTRRVPSPLVSQSHPPWDGDNINQSDGFPKIKIIHFSSPSLPSPISN